MAKQRIRIIDHRVVKEYPESKRKKLIDFYFQGAEECDGSESDSYSYIASALHMGAIEVDSDKQKMVFPEGSEGALLQQEIMKDLAACGIHIQL